MKIRVDEQSYDLEMVLPLGAGGEGEIYPLDAASLAKIYYEDVLNRHRQEKVLALCDKYTYFRGVLGDGNFAFPRKSALDADTGDVIGFEMADLGRLPRLSQVFFDPGAGSYRSVDGRQLDDATAIELVYDLFERLERLHMARILVGDLNPGNILYDLKAGKPIFIDLDSVVLGQFESNVKDRRKGRKTSKGSGTDSEQQFDCEVFSEEYLDPEVEKRGRTVSGALKYTCEGDVFSMAVIGFELFVGTNPYYHRCTPSRSVPENKRLRASLLGHHANSAYLSGLGVTYAPSPVHDNILGRIEVLKKTDLVLYRYLVDVLTKGVRESLLKRLKVNDPRHPAHSFFGKSICDLIKEGWEQTQVRQGRPMPKLSILTQADIEIIDGFIDRSHQARTTLKLKHEAQRSNDPPAFKQLVENMGINYGRLISEGVK